MMCSLSLDHGQRQLFPFGLVMLVSAVVIFSCREQHVFHPGPCWVRQNREFLAACKGANGRISCFLCSWDLPL